MKDRRKKPQPVPSFKSEAEEAEFWSTHSSADYDFVDTGETVELAGALKRRVQQRKQLLTLRLEKKQIDQAKRIARRKSLGYQTLMRMWIAEGIERELLK